MSEVFFVDAALSITDIPSALHEYPHATCAVIDVIRATTTMSMLEERGAEIIQVVSSLEEALEIGQEHKEYFLVGENQGERPEGFHFGNSPAEIAQSNFTKKHVIIATTNGTKAIAACFAHNAGVVAAACLRNAAPAAQCMLAAFPAPALVVCAGRKMRPSADDTYTAGVILTELLRLASQAGIDVRLGETAQIAVAYAESCGNNELRFLHGTQSGQTVLNLHLDADLQFCAQRNVRDTLPIIEADDAGRLLAQRSHLFTAK